MILELYTVQDSKVGAYMPPFAARSKGEALRSFMSACSDEKHQFNAHRADYVLFHIGSFDDVSGLVLCGSPDRVIGGDEF